MTKVKSKKLKVESWSSFFAKRKFWRAGELRRFFIKRRAFTVAELLVAVGLFTTIITIAIGSYLRMLQQQRLMTGLMAANDNVSLVLEQMMREMRTGSGFPGDGHSGSQIAFNNDRGCKVTYEKKESGITRKQEATGGGCASEEGGLTSDNVKVENLSFSVSSKNGAGILSGTNFELIGIDVSVSNQEVAGVTKTNEIKTKVSARKYFGE